MKTKYYYLFGDEAVRTFDNEGIEQVIKENEQGLIEYETYEYDITVDHPTEFLWKAQGYERFKELTEYEFLKLQ